MPSRYSQIFETQPISQYVPLPLDLMGKALASKQQQYDTAIDTASKVEDEILKVNAIDSHKPFKNQLINQYTNKVESIADQIVKTGDTSKVRELKSIANQWRNDPLRQELETSYANYNKYVEDKIKKGEKYGKWHDTTLGFAGETEKGEIEPFRYYGMGEKQDHQKAAREMMSGIKASSSEWYDAFEVDPKTQNITKVKRGKEGLAGNYLLGIADRKTDDFLSTSEGDDFIKQMKYYNPKASNEQLRHMATEYLYDAGINQLYTKTTIDKDFKFGPESLSGTDAGGPAVPYYPGPATQFPAKGYDLKSFDVRPAGNIPYTDSEVKDIYKSYGIDITKPLTKQQEGQMEIATKKISKGKDVKYISIVQPNDLPVKEKEFALEFIKNTNPDLYKRIQKNERIPLGELSPIYNKIKESAAIVDKDIMINSGVRGLTKKQQEDENRWLFGTADKKTVKTLGTGLAVNAKFFVPSLGETLTYDELKSKFNEDANVEVTGKFSPANPFVRKTNDKNFANAKQISIDGVEVIVSGPEKMVSSTTGLVDQRLNYEIESNKNINEIYDVRFTPSYPVVKNLYGKEYKLIYNKIDDNNGIYTAQDEQGNVIDKDANGNSITSPDQLNLAIASNELNKYKKK